MSQVTVAEVQKEARGAHPEMERASRGLARARARHESDSLSTKPVPKRGEPSTQPLIGLFRMGCRGRSVKRAGLPRRRVRGAENPMSGCGLEDDHDGDAEVPRGCEKRRGGWSGRLVACGRSELRLAPRLRREQPRHRLAGWRRCSGRSIGRVPSSAFLSPRSKNAGQGLRGVFRTGCRVARSSPRVATRSYSKQSSVRGSATKASRRLMKVCALERRS
jgi:hypothetical protein